VVLEPGVVNQVAEAAPPNFAMPNMRMTVHSRAQSGLRVIQVKCQDIFQSNQFNE
jgi:hypothetical protein